MSWRFTGAVISGRILAGTKPVVNIPLISGIEKGTEKTAAVDDLSW